MSTRRPSRRFSRFPRFTLLALGVAAAMLLVGYVLQRKHTPVAEPVRVLFAPKPQPGSAPPAPAVDLAASAPAARSKPGPDEAELCGVGVYKQRDLLAGRVHPEGLPDMRQTGEAVVRELAARPEPQARATALALQTMAPLWNGLREQLDDPAGGTCALPDFPGAPVSAPAASDARCVAALAQRQQVWQAEAFAATLPLTQLVQLAQQSSDPALFALAQSLCSSPVYQGVAACKANLLDQWARVEPANAQSWLMMAGRAQAAQDGNAESQALNQAALARYQRGYVATVMPWLLRDVPTAQRNAADLVRDQLAGRLTLMQSGTQRAGLALGEACKAERMQDGNRRQLCAKLADVVSGDTDSPVDAMIAARVGQRAGWSEARYQAAAQPVRDTLDAMGTLLLRQPSFDQVTGLSCEVVGARSAYLRSIGRLGELRAMREAVAASAASSPLLGR